MKFSFPSDYFYVHLLLSFSPVYRCSYSPHGAYAQSKLALVLFTYRLQHLLTANGSHVTANVVDPGVVNTELYKHVFWVVKMAIWMTAWLFFKVCSFFKITLLLCPCIVRAVVSREFMIMVFILMIFIAFLCPDEMNRIDKDRPSLEQTLLLHEETKPYSQERECLSLSLPICCLSLPWPICVSFCMHGGRTSS